MEKKETITNTIKNNLNWFINSGVMLPPDGSWGVAERVAVADNSAIEKMLTTFQAWTQHEDHFIIEQRRADCCFESALYFLDAATIDKKYWTIGENILDFLYFKSGLLNRSSDKFPIGVWNWSHINWVPTVFFDDNAWCIYIQLEIAKRYPELDIKYQCRKWALKGAKALFEACKRTFGRTTEEKSWVDPEKFWLGNYYLPHWGGLANMALALTEVIEYQSEIERYFSYTKEHFGEYNSSELAYLLFTSTITAKASPENPLYRELANMCYSKILSKLSSAGNLPAEHYETPNGKHLIDTIYTANWALFGLGKYYKLTQNAEVLKPWTSLMQLLIKIQDKANEKSYNGCWRGMYDQKSKQWGGGDCYEGGAGSIYTGWTNAIIGLSLLDYLKK